MAAALVVVAGIGGWMVFRPGPSSASDTTLTYTVQRTTVQQTVSASGTLAAAQEADLDFAVTGTVTRVLAQTGDHVRKGQALARLDATTLRAEYQSALANLSSAQTQYSADASAGAGSTQLAADSAQIASAQSDLAQARTNLADATLRATFSGVIAARNLDPGDTVSGASGSGGSGSTGGNTGNGSSGGSGASNTGSSSSSGTSAFVLIKPGTFTVDAGVSATDIASVKKGMQVQLTPTGTTGSLDTARAGSGGTIYGTVTSVGLIADASSTGAATFPVTVTVTGSHPELYAGTSVSVSIITKQVPNVLAVPALALSSGNGKTYVTKMVGGKAVKTAVTIGRTFGAQTEITTGLSAGDVVQLVTFSAPRTTQNGQTGRNGITRLGGFGGGGNFSGPPGGFGQ